MRNKVNFEADEKLIWIQLSFSQTGCLTKAKERSLPYYSFIGGGRRENIWIHAFPNSINAKQNVVSSRIWTRVMDSISCNRYRYTKHASE